MSSRSRLALASMLVLSLLAAPAAPAYTLDVMARARFRARGAGCHVWSKR